MLLFQLCFAYKLASPVTTLVGQLVDPLFKTLTPFTSSISLTADKAWHYTCYDLQVAYQATKPTGNYPIHTVKLFSAALSPTSPDMLIDVVSLRKDYPLGVGPTENMRQLNSRRIMPTRQYTYGTFNLTKSNISASLSYRPINCSAGLSQLTLLSSFSEGAPSMSQNTAASGAVNGTFSLAWNGEDLSGMKSFYFKEVIRLV